MLLKSSKNNGLLILGISVVLIATLFLLQNFTKKQGEFSNIIVPEIEQKTPLYSLQITIKEKHYKKIKKRRNRSLADGVMATSESDYIPAIITFNGDNLKADIRLKGDWTDHLKGVKWSYRIKLKNSKTILGMRKFSIHHPKTRGYINEWLYHKVNKDENLIGLRYHFTEGFLHVKLKNSDIFINKNVGIYAIEESFDKRTIESNQRKEGVILRISEQYFWKEMKQAFKIRKKTGQKKHSNYRNPKFTGPGHEYLSTFGYSKIRANESLNKQFIQAKNLLELYRTRKLQASEVFDTDKLALHVAINNLFAASHGLEAINIRMYYNPTTSKLEPISYDGNSGEKLKRFVHYQYTNTEKDTVYRNALIKALEKVSEPTYLEAFFTRYKKDLTQLEAILKTEFKKVSAINKKNYIYNQTFLTEELNRLKSL